MCSQRLPVVATGDGLAQAPKWLVDWLAVSYRPRAPVETAAGGCRHGNGHAWRLTGQHGTIGSLSRQEQFSELVLFGLNNQLVVSYKEENAMALKNLFLKDYGGVDEDDYSVAVYSQQGVYDSLFYLLEQYSQLGRLAVGPITYAEDEDGGLLPLVICKNLYRRGSVAPSDEAYDIDAQLETVCLSLDPKTAHQWKTNNASFYDLDFYRLVDMKITFNLKGINLQTVRSRELPDCYSFSVMITFDNQCHSGKVKLFLDIDAQSSACRGWKISGTAQKSTHYLLVFDGFVIVVCLTSAVLCTRSIVLAVRLLQRFSRFLHENYNRKVCEGDQGEFLNGWYVLVIVSDLLTIIGSILKMEIQAKSLTSYDVCSIFLGTATLLVWVGVIRYLGYFQKYNLNEIIKGTRFEDLDDIKMVVTMVLWRIPEESFQKCIKAWQRWLGKCLSLWRRYVEREKL
ncbi:mucolipin-2 isoform X3 [Phyllopteryx taeniolatus]|uniref:mucolipin-2 isoform X3 n=1 Tax=Phyllopteryx taeniolatus TaxID=161469 RepID=UPI002AD3100F|nr:mucolipin-2 isoform X3 [Phyllopteryx taeniolatus]